MICYRLMSGIVDEIWRSIQEARSVLRPIIHMTPLDMSMTLSRLSGGHIYLKLENLQKTGSFKVRGAYYKIWKSSKERSIKVCVAASSGNHAQGVAYASSLQGIPSIIVMPEHTPVAKVMATKGYGAKVVLHGATYDESFTKAMEICKKEKGLFVHPFNDPLVIAGQGTIGIEIYEALRNVDVVLVPVGGGGLISGIAIALKKLKPSVKIYGIQPRGAPAMALSFKERRLVMVRSPDTIADAVALKKPGDITFKIISELVDDMLLVSENDIVKAMLFLLERCKCVAEPAGALGVAALLGGHLDVSNKNVAVVISGGNVDMPLLARIIERGLVLEGREVKIRGVLPDRPGMLKEVLEVLAEAKANIITVDHDRISPELSPNKAKVTITMEIYDVTHVKELIEKLKCKGFEFEFVKSD